eukprot:2047347-Pyramimonas_sp.AAC.1
MILTSWGPLGNPLGVFWGRLCGLLGIVRIALGVQELALSAPGPPCNVLVALLGPPLGPLVPSCAPEDRKYVDAENVYCPVQH